MWCKRIWWKFFPPKLMARWTVETVHDSRIQYGPDHEDLIDTIAQEIISDIERIKNA